MPQVPGRRRGGNRQVEHRQAEQQAEPADDEVWFHLAAPLRSVLDTHDAADAIRQREEQFKTAFLPGTKRVLASPMAAPNPKIPASSAARANLAKTMDRVCNDHEALIITRNGEQSVVMLSLDDFKSLEEAAYLLRSPANAKRLLAATEALQAGKGKERKLAK